MNPMLHWRPLPWLLAVLLAAWTAYGVWPISPVEGDDLGIVNGLAAWRRGAGDFDRAGYLYAIQPGSYVALRALGKVAPVDDLTLFAWWTMAGAAAFALLSARLVAEILEQRFAWMLVAMLTLQECTAAACYANTSAAANAVVLLGLCCAHWAHERRGLWLAGLLIALGGWLRADSLLITPAVLALRVARTGGRQGCRETSEVAVVALAGCVALYFGTHAGLGELFRTYRDRPNDAAPDLLGQYGWLVLGRVATVVSALGLLVALGRRQFHIAALVVLGAGASWLVYHGNFASPKYLHVALPFLALPACWLGRELVRATARRKVAALALAIPVLAHVGEGLVGAQTSHEEIRRSTPRPPHGAVDLTALLGRRLVLGMGEGEILFPADGPRLRTGFLWAPVVWHRLKRGMLAEQARVHATLAAARAPRILTSNYLSFRVVDGWLRAQGYHEHAVEEFNQHGSWLSHWSGPRGRAELALINNGADERALVARLSAVDGEVFFLCDRGFPDFQELVGGEGAADRWPRLSAEPDGLMALYRRAGR